MKITTWNTGAHYTENGQRIAAAEVEGGIVFLDLDRGIDGFIPVKNALLDLRDRAQFAYDFGQYESAWQHEETLKTLAAAAARAPIIKGY